MSLIINQGKQDTSSDNNFEVMVSANEIAQITKMEMDKDWDNTLNITFKVISDGKIKTPDFGGDASTMELTKAIVKELI